MKKLSAAALSELATEALVSLALGKACYKHQDALMEVILLNARRKADEKLRVKIDRKKIEESLRTALDLAIATLDGKTFRIADKFSDRNSIGVGLSARRYELEEVTSP